jgi:hypothetical protein
MICRLLVLDIVRAPDSAVIRDHANDVDRRFRTVVMERISAF